SRLRVRRRRILALGGRRRAHFSVERRRRRLTALSRATHRCCADWSLLCRVVTAVPTGHCCADWSLLCRVVAAVPTCRSTTGSLVGRRVRRSVCVVGDLGRRRELLLLPPVRRAFAVRRAPVTGACVSAPNPADRRRDLERRALHKGAFGAAYPQCRKPLPARVSGTA